MNTDIVWVCVIAMMMLSLVECQSPHDRAAALLKKMVNGHKLALVRGYSGPYVGNVNGLSDLTPPVPAIHLEDGPQGVADGVKNVTCWPASLTVAASWDEDLMYQWGVALGKEQRGKGTNIHLGPDINIIRVPLGGRVFEMFGEEPYLTSRLVGPNVKGVQSQGVMACAKHYIDNEQEYQRTSMSSEVWERTNWEVYYPPFQSAVSAGVGSVMCSYNKINSTWACENHQTLQVDLKDRLGFQGFVMSDWGATHSTVQSAMAGLDMEMPGSQYYGSALENAVTSGQVPQSRLDDMVLRILTSMFQVGLFDNPQTGDLSKNVQSPEHVALARQLSQAGTVLLKNDKNILPLGKSVKKIAVIGDNGHDSPTIAGGGSGHVQAPYVSTPLQGITSRAGSSISVQYANSKASNIAQVARDADVAIVFVGTTSSEGSDRANLQLPNNQDGMVRTVVSAQPNTIVVVFTPGAVLMPWANQVDAILCSFFPGQEVGNAIASILFGDYNPGAKLPLTIPVNENDWFSGRNTDYPGVNGHVQYSEGLMVGYRWYDTHNINPLFPFGHGLSYTSFNYTNLKSTGKAGDGSLIVTVDVKNTGKVEGSEVAQLYLGFPSGSGEPPKVLKGFQKMTLNPGQSQTATFKLTPRDVSTWSTIEHAWKMMTGTYAVMVGSSSRDIRIKGSFTV